MPFPSIDGLLHRDWGPSRIVALGGLRRHTRSGLEFEIEVVLQLERPPALVASGSCTRVVIALPVGLLPWLAVGAQFEDGVLCKLPSGRGVSIVATHSPSNDGFTVEHLQAVELPRDWARGIPPNAESIGIRTRTVRVPMMRLTGSEGSWLLPTWEAIRAFYAWTTTLAHHIVSGATGESLVSRLGWRPPTQLGMAAIAWPQRVAPGKYRIRLRSGTDQSKETATMVAMSEVLPRVRRAIGRIQESLSRSNAATRMPETLLPVDGAVRLDVLPGSDPMLRRVAAITAIEWPPPFDELELLTSDAEGAPPTEHEGRFILHRAAIDSLTGERPRRGNTGQAGLIRAPMRSIAAQFTPRVTRVPRLGMPLGDIRRYQHRVPVGSLAFGSSSATDAAVPRGVALTGSSSPPAEASALPSKVSDDLAAVCDVLALALERASARNRLGWDAVATVLRSSATVGALTSRAGSDEVRRRRLTIVDVGIDDWGVSIVDLERYPGDAGRHLHGLAIVSDVSAGCLPSSGALADALLASRGRIPGLGSTTHEDLLWRLVRHSNPRDRADRRQTALVRRLVGHLVRHWSAAHPERA